VSERCRVLLLAANPIGSKLRLDEEVREIDRKLRSSEHRDGIELITHGAARPEDLIDFLNRYQPHVVHFSGHGSPSQEIMLLDSSGKAVSVSEAALVRLFEAVKDNIRLVVLNACYSRSQASAIVRIIDCAIGMDSAIGDKSAIVFAATFYQAIGYRRSVEEAFRQAQAALLLENLPEEHVPTLHRRIGVDAGMVYLNAAAPSMGQQDQLRGSQARPTTSQKPLPHSEPAASVEPANLTHSVHDPQWSKHEDKDYQALTRDGRYDTAAALAEGALVQAQASGDERLVAHWADRVAAAYRTIGFLRKASAFYGFAWFTAQRALEHSPDDLHLRYQAGKTRFGSIMVDDYLMRGAFAEALRRHGNLLKDADVLLDAMDSHPSRANVVERRIHIQRQQAEMLRYLGRYSESLQAIRAVRREYPKHSLEPLSYSRLSEADSLRLLGDTAAATAAYEEVESTARARGIDGLLGAVLWRRCCLFQLLQDDAALRACVAELGGLASTNERRYRYIVIYSSLVRAAGRVTDVQSAFQALDRAESFGPLRPEYLVAEYAHATLCRAELFRQLSDDTQARACFLKAYDSYLRMECRWGVVRSWIGLELSGERVPFPPALRSTLEGLDMLMLTSFEQQRAIAPGALSMNIP
jgi:tetratricopeptide (TPR) repeat protein